MLELGWAGEIAWHMDTIQDSTLASGNQSCWLIVQNRSGHQEEEDVQTEIRTSIGWRLKVGIFYVQEY